MSLVVIFSRLLKRALTKKGSRPAASGSTGLKGPADTAPAASDRRPETRAHRSPGNRKPITLVLADDHPILLEGLATILGREKDMTVLKRCPTCDEVLPALRRHRPDILLIDCRMENNGGFDVIRRIAQERLPTRTLILTARLDHRQTLEAARLNVFGVVLKRMAPELLLQCIRTVASGEKWLERDSITKALDHMVRRETFYHDIVARLTKREIEIARLAASGLRNKDIGRKLFIHEGTVKVHLHKVFDKLNVDGRHALGKILRQSGVANDIGLLALICGYGLPLLSIL